MNFEVENLIVNTLKAHEALTAIVNENSIYATHFPNTFESCPYIVIDFVVDEDHCEDVTLFTGDLLISIITRKNTNTQARQIVDIIKMLIDNKGFQSSNLNVSCRFSKTLQLDTSRLKLQPKPMGCTLRYVVTGVEI